MIDETFIQAVADLGHQAEAKEYLQLPGDSPSRVMMLGSDGKYHPTVLARPPLSHHATDLETIVDRCFDHKDKAEIWVSINRVEGCMGEVDRCSLDLLPSAAFAQLVAWGQRVEWKNQRELISILRKTFRNSIQSTSFEDLIRRVKVITTANNEHNKTSRNVSTDVRAQVGESTELPDYITFDVPIVANYNLGFATASIDCVLEFDPTLNPPQFLIQPCAGEIEKATARFEQSVGDRLDSLIHNREEVEGVEPKAIAQYSGREGWAGFGR